MQRVPCVHDVDGRPLVVVAEESGFDTDAALTVVVEPDQAGTRRAGCPTMGWLTSAVKARRDTGAMWPRVRNLRTFQLGRPGEMQERLNSAVLAGEKVATGGLLRQEYVDQDEVVEHVGERQILLDGDDEPLALVQITRVETHRFVAVPWEFAAAEGEGFESIEHWRDGHRSFYAAEGRAVSDDDLMVCVWFDVMEVLRGTSGPRPTEAPGVNPA